VLGSVMSNPESHRHVHLCIRVVICITLFCVGVWAVVPIESVHADPSPSELEAFSSPQDSNQPERVAIDQSAFNVTLWHVPPKPEVAEVQERRVEQRVVYQLLGISSTTNESGESILHGVIYDPGEDQVYTIAEGDRIQAFTVTKIKRRSVELQSGNRVVHLTLDLGEES
jgi:hypothetical protein